MADKKPKGKCYLVGAGPGDLGLVTLRAKECIEEAEVIVYDYLCNPEMLKWAPESAEVIYAGKKAGAHTLTQEEINALLVEKALAGKNVVRLKGGDPFVFGRGAEEAQALATARVPFVVVPGITSAIAGPAYAGIPVTHRGLSASVTIASGHTASDYDWHALATGSGTLVFLMALGNLEEIVERLLAHGRAADEPAAVIQWATTARQRTVHAPLATIAEGARHAQLGSPAVLVVGPTAALAQQLAGTRQPTEQRQEVLV